jgi:hypothetical protein
MTVNVHVSYTTPNVLSDWEDFYFESAAEAVLEAREIAEGWESSDFYWDDRGFYVRHGKDDYPEFRQVNVYDEANEEVVWRVEE